MNKFVNYIMDFYGKDGIYDMNVSKEEILIAIGIRLERFKEIPFGSDSVDREYVRDIIIEKRNNHQLLN